MGQWLGVGCLPACTNAPITYKRFKFQLFWIWTGKKYARPEPASRCSNWLVAIKVICNGVLCNQPALALWGFCPVLPRWPLSTAGGSEPTGLTGWDVGPPGVAVVWPYMNLIKASTLLTLEFYFWHVFSPYWLWPPTSPIWILYLCTQSFELETEGIQKKLNVEFHA